MASPQANRNALPTAAVKVIHQLLFLVELSPAGGVIA